MRAPRVRGADGRGSVWTLTPPRTPTPTEQAVVDAAPLADVRRAVGGAGSSDPLAAGLRRAGLLRLLVLHLCGQGACYGNQLIERIARLSGGLVSVNPNTMYPLLRALEGDGLIAGEWEHPERRSRRFYRITPGGEAERARLADEIRPILDAAAGAIDAVRRELTG